MSDLISREALLKAMEEERQYLLARGQTGAEHILVHHCLPLIDNAPSVEGPKYILKIKNLTAEKKKRFQEEWNKSVDGLLAIPDDYEIIPIERPQGEWLVVGHDDTTFWYRCSNCEYEEHDNFTKHYRFCPHCGADMRGRSEHDKS